MLKKLNMVKNKDGSISHKPEYVPSGYDQLVKDMAEHFCQKQGIRMKQRTNGLPSAAERIAMSYINLSMDKGMTIGQIREKFDEIKLYGI